ISYVVFDLLAIDDVDLRASSLDARKARLKALLDKTPSTLAYSSHTAGDGAAILESACQAKLEGIICKKLTAGYYEGRSADWIKVKCRNRQEFVVIGYTQTEKRTRGVSALLLGVQENGSVSYVGRVGTGFTEDSARAMEARLSPLKIKEPPLADAPKSRPREKTVWVKPEQVVEVEFAEWTSDGLLRQASFKGIREDKAPSEVRKEEPEMTEAKKTIKLTSPDKEMFDGITKKQVADYYKKISKKMLPYTENRVLSIVRCPDGEKKACFFQKHLSEPLPGISLIEIEEKDGDLGEYFYLSEADGLLSAVQYGTLEFHTWGSRIDTLEEPDLLVFDLDPDEGMDLSKVREAVRDLKSLLDELDLTSFLKTSGGKGYHVVVPFKPSASWEDARTFSQNVAKAMEAKWPKKYTSNMRKEKRKGKVFVDWIRNGRGATSVAPYSLRARPGAPISCPIGWSELDTIGPADITLENIGSRSRKQPWRQFFSVSQRLTASMTKD
ncbi:MAG TPA: DNA ligase D, partial [Fastidiosipila sp.]|nr:DNA ligase D [Fastidiosipila sp.]